jgi:hypothetical protein
MRQLLGWHRLPPTVIVPSASGVVTGAESERALCPAIGADPHTPKVVRRALGAVGVGTATDASKTMPEFGAAERSEGRQRSDGRARPRRAGHRGELIARAHITRNRTFISLPYHGSPRISPHSLAQLFRFGLLRGYAKPCGGSSAGAYCS